MCQRYIQCNPIFLLVLNVTSVLVVVAQNFGNCDFHKELKPGTVYTITSPNYNQPYAAGTFCRYTGSEFIILMKRKINSYNVQCFALIDLAYAPRGYQINLKCTEVNMPYVSALCQCIEIYLPQSQSIGFYSIGIVFVAIFYSQIDVPAIVYMFHEPEMPTYRTVIAIVMVHLPQNPFHSVSSSVSDNT